MSEMNKAFDPEFMRERQLNDRKIIIETMNNVQKCTFIRDPNKKKHPFEILDDRFERRKE